MQVIIRNSRRPDFARADLHALTAACRIAASRVTELCDRFGVTQFETALDHLLERNKFAFAKLLKTSIPNDKMYFECVILFDLNLWVSHGSLAIRDFMDDDGTGVGPWKVCCTMFKEKNAAGEDMLVYDFEGTDPQADSSINWFLSPNTWKMSVCLFRNTVPHSHY